MAENANWENASIDYYFASQANLELKSEWTLGSIVLIGIFCLFIILGLVGTIIELSRIGDIKEINYIELERNEKF